MRISAVLISLQVLGQAVLGFELSVAQILLCIGTSAVLETFITLLRKRVLAWPASALLTGNGVALLLRVPGTAHGDWWSLRGAWIYCAVSAISLASKYVIRFRGRHIFNPSNFGLALCFLTLGSNRVDPQDLWWGPWSVRIIAVISLITIGALLVTRKLGMFPVAFGFWATFAAGVGLLAVSGHGITARWHLGPVAGSTYWTALVFSPEVLIFLFFMIPDPKTAPDGRVARAVFGASVGLLACVLIALQTTEYATKTALLVSLLIVCLARPAIERWVPAPGSDLDHLRRWSGAGPSTVGIGTLAGTARLRRTLSVAVAGMLVVLAAGQVTPETSALKVAQSSVDPRSLPPIDVDAAVTEEIAGFDAESARPMVAGLMASLRVEAMAIRQRDPALASQAATGARLNEIKDQIARARPGEPVGVRGYKLAEVRVILTSGRSSPQELPQLGLLARGSTWQETWDNQTLAVQSSPLAFTATFVMVRRGATYLLAADDTAGTLPAVEPATISTDQLRAGVLAGHAVDEGSQPGQLPIFQDVTTSAGVRIRTGSLEVDRVSDPSPDFWKSASGWDVLLASQSYLISGQAWGDVNGDGRPDLFLTDQTGPNHLFLNEGDGSFRPAPGGLADPIRLPGGHSGSANFVDFDNSGRPSLLILTDNGPRLFKNEAGERFREVTKAAGLNDDGRGQSAAWSDIDGDGDLDLYLANYGCQPCGAQNRAPYDLGQGKLFLNNGDATFDDRTELLAGVSGTRGLSFSAAWLDYNDDGRPDLFIANDTRSEQTASTEGRDDRQRLTNVLVRNDGPGCGGWCFSDVSAEADVDQSALTMGVAVGDFSGTGRPDIFYTNGGFIGGPTELLANEGNGRFVRNGSSRGANLAEWSWGASPIDVNNDGLLDVFVSVGHSDALLQIPLDEVTPALRQDLPTARAQLRSGALQLRAGASERPAEAAEDPHPRTENNRLLLQGPDGKFEVHSIGREDGLPPPHYGNAVADFDGDGWSDVVVGNLGDGYTLLRNTAQTGRDNHRLAIRLSGDGRRVNRDAVGSRVTVLDTDGRRHVGWVQMGGSMGGGADTQVLIGMGTADAARIEIRWPDGSNQIIAHPPTDAAIQVTYGSAEIRTQPFAPNAESK